MKICRNKLLIFWQISSDSSTKFVICCAYIFIMLKSSSSKVITYVNHGVIRTPRLELRGGLFSGPGSICVTRWHTASKMPVGCCRVFKSCAKTELSLSSPPPSSPVSPIVQPRVQPPLFVEQAWVLSGRQFSSRKSMYCLLVCDCLTVCHDWVFNSLSVLSYGLA